MGQACLLYNICMKELSFVAVFAACLLAAVSFKGCKNTPDQPSPGQGTNIVEQTASSAVCIGVENGWAGACPGALQDAKRMAKVFETQVSEVTLLLDKDATLASVKAAL